MVYQVDMDGKIRMLIRRLHPEQKRKIKESLRAIAKDPQSGKLLQDNLTGFISYRVATFRIIYSVDRKKRSVHIIAIGPRYSIYEDLEHELISKRGIL